MRLSCSRPWRAVRAMRAVRARHAAAAVEMAFVSPVLVLLILGLIECGRAFMVQQVMTNGAREGARRAILDGATNAEVTKTVNDYLAAAGISGHTATCTPSPEAAASGSRVTVGVQVPFAEVSWLPSHWLGERTLQASVAMRKE